LKNDRINCGVRLMPLQSVGLSISKREVRRLLAEA
jgi:hypothetical protein